MSDETLNLFLEKTEQALLNASNILGNPAVNNPSQEMEIIFQSFFERDEMNPEKYPFITLIMRLEKAPIDGSFDHDVSKEFLSYIEIERKILINIMNIVYIQGSIDNSTDLEKRKYWFEKIRDANVNDSTM